MRARRVRRTTQPEVSLVVSLGVTWTDTNRVDPTRDMTTRAQVLRTRIGFLGEPEKGRGRKRGKKLRYGRAGLRSRDLKARVRLWTWPRIVRYENAIQSDDGEDLLYAV